MRRYQDQWIRSLVSVGVVACTAFIVLIYPCGASADDAKRAAEFKVAAAFQLPQLPQIPGVSSLTGPSADWRQFD